MAEKIVLAFDSFKGNLTAPEVCGIVREGIRSVRPDLPVYSCPMADGGEGTARILMNARNGEWIPAAVSGPLFRAKVCAGFAWFDAGRTAAVEMAAASGLPLLKPEERNPLETTTFGTGELIRAAVEKGAERILLTVGGSATVDGGLGAAAALGWRFLDAADNEVPLNGRGAGFVEKIIPPEHPGLPPVDVLCDVSNPLCGSAGAARVYGPQKGATPEMVEQLDTGLLRFSGKIRECTGVRVVDLPGGGAAGGLAAGAAAFMNARLVRGIDRVIEWTGLNEALQGASWILTGEGKFDAQSLQGKVIDGIIRLAQAAGAKTGVIAGSIHLDESVWRAAGASFAATLQPEGMSAEESIRRSRELLFESAVAFARDLTL